MNKIMLNENLKINNRLIPYSISFEQNEAEMSLTEHLEEVRQRAFLVSFSIGNNRFRLSNNSKEYC